MAPVIRQLQKQPDKVICWVCVTAQHRQMLDQVLRLFDIVPDYGPNVLEENQSPAKVASAVLARLEHILQASGPTGFWWSDTTRVAAASLVAFYARVKVGHVEAGLCTQDKWPPFLEEINRRVSGAIAELHFAPKERAQQNLLREGAPDECIMVTGDRVIDAPHLIAVQPLASRVR